MTTHTAPHTHPLAFATLTDGPTLHLPVHQHPGQTSVYGIAHHFQVSPTQMVLVVNRRHTGVAMVDFEDGFDFLVIDDLGQIAESRAVVGIHSEPARHPETGRPLTLVYHNPQGGFVPLGAKLADGSPHPAAGTGFGVSVVHGFPADEVMLNAHTARLYTRLMLVQFAFDGVNFRITSTRMLQNDNLLPGWLLMNRGLGPALPDGPDLLMGMIGGRDDEPARAHAQRLRDAGRKPHVSANRTVGECYGSGLSRWRFSSDGWQPVDFVPVTGRGPDMSTEPSLIRDRDNSLLFCVRGKGSNAAPGQFDEGHENTYEHFRIYRSTDNGASWQSHMHLPEMRSPTPVTLNQTAAGLPFLAANPWLPLQTDSRNRTVPKITYREQLCVWPLSDDRTTPLDPICIFDTVARLGPARPIDTGRHDNRWYADHPVTGIYRLADGRWHTLLTFRVSDSAVNFGGAAPAPTAGLYVAHLPHETPSSKGPWRF